MDSTKYHFFHTTPIQIRFNDIDTLDHVTNSVYQQYFDLGRMNYFEEVLKEKIDWRVEGLILVGISINFLVPVKLHDEVQVQTKIVKLGNKSLEMAQQVVNTSAGTIAAQSNATMVGFCGKDEVSIPLPERWRKKIKSYENDINFGL